MSCVVAEDSNPPLQEHMMISLFALEPWHEGLMSASSQRPLVFNLKTPEGFLRDLNVLQKIESVL